MVKEDPKPQERLPGIIQTFISGRYRAAASIFASEKGEATSNEEVAGELPVRTVRGDQRQLASPWSRDEDPGGALGQLRDEIDTDDALRVLP